MKKIWLTVLIILLGIQLIQPARNKSGQVMQTDIIKVYNVPQDVQAIFKIACYDCHSNNTRYPWYAQIQPMGWVLSKHIKEGKAELNFSEFGSYSGRRQQSKLSSIASQIKDGEMPLPSYLLIHHDAKLTDGQKALVIDWALTAYESIKQKD